MSSKMLAQRNSCFCLRNVPRDKQSVVATERETLADYVRRVINEKGLSYRRVAEMSGGQISHVTVGEIINGNRTDIKTDTLLGLAKGLGVPAEEIFAVARGKSPADDPEFKTWKYAALFDDAKKLTPEQMVKFENIMDIARREVERMLQEKANEPPRKKGKKS
jgi:transcriptional regulator with XRE-family HTH domain